MTEFIKFELTLHFDEEYNGSIKGLQQEITRAIIKYIDSVQDIEIEAIETGKI